MRILISLLVALLFVACSPSAKSTTQRYQQDQCPLCIGKGVCHQCHGSAKCQHCDGTGKRVSSTKNLTGEGIKLMDLPAEPCPFCSGTGKCAPCAGTGKCSECKGSGKVATWNLNGTSGAMGKIPSTEVSDPTALPALAKPDTLAPTADSVPTAQ